MFTELAVIEFFNQLSKKWPDARTELEYENAFQLLIAVVLSAQATDKSVNKVGATLFKLIRTPYDIIKIGEENLRYAIKSIGLSNSKARNIFNLSRQLINEFNAQVPNNLNDLQSLPGVGRKTANVILNIIYNQPTIAVDTHIFRLCNRTKLACGATPLAVETALETVVPDTIKLNCHHLLILHGRYICQARKPQCQKCCVNNLCQYENKNF